MTTGHDAVVIGSGPNGLAAAAALAREGASVLVLEAEDEIGGGTRTAELTLPGFLHDICSAVHPMGLLSPYFRTLDLEAHGLRWVLPPASVAHPLDDEPAVMLWRSTPPARASARTGRPTEGSSRLFSAIPTDFSAMYWRRSAYRGIPSCWRDSDSWDSNRRAGLPADIFERRAPGRSLQVLPPMRSSP